MRVCSHRSRGAPSLCPHATEPQSSPTRQACDSAAKCVRCASWALLRALSYGGTGRGVRQVPVRLHTVAQAGGLGRYRSDYGGTGGGVRQVPVRCMGSPHPCCSFGSKDRTHPRHKRSTGRGVGVGAALRVSRPRPPSHSSPGRKGRVPGVTQDLPGAAPFCKSRDRNDRSGDCRKLPPLGSEPAQAAGAPLRGLREPDSLPCAAHLALLCAEPSTRDFV